MPLSFGFSRLITPMLHCALVLLLLATIATAHDGEGASVESVIPGSPAEAAGLQVGDRILQLAGDDLATADDLQRVLSAHRPGDTVPLLIDREGEEIDIELTFGERADGGVSLGVSLALMGSSDGRATAPKDGLARDDCLAWVNQAYQVETVAGELGLDLSDELREVRACMEGDVRRMATPIPRAWCDNVFKIHCSGLDLLAEIGEAQVSGCKAALSRSLALDLDRDERWTTCAEQKVFERYSMRGETSDEADCKAILLEECGESAWSQWGGPDQDFSSPAGELAASWPDEGPRTLWDRDLGEGQSAILYQEGRLYTMYRSGTVEAVVSLDTESGETVWEQRYEAPYSGLTQYGSGPRATPLVIGDRIFSVGITGRMHALDKRNGEVLWRQDLWGSEFAGNSLEHGYASSPVAYRDTVIVSVGGEDAALVAFDQKSGDVRWRSLDYRNSYSSPRIVSLAGEEQLVVFMAEELIGVDPDDGGLLWRYPHANQWGHNISMPVIDGDRIFLSSPQAGARGLRLNPEGGTIEVEQVWSTRRIQFYHSTAIRQGDWVYGSSGTMGPSFMTAINLLTGEIGWRERGPAKANVVGADGRLVILDEDGMLYLAEASPERFELLAESPLLARPAWTVPTIVGQTLYARDQRRIVAVNLG